MCLMHKWKIPVLFGRHENNTVLAAPWFMTIESAFISFQSSTVVISY
jgi:hypothetical protein